MAGVSRETKIDIVAASSMFPGFRFSPTDEELISYYLKKKMEGFEKCVEVISEVEICKHEPWDLPVKSVIPSENEWFFFSPRGRKYPNGSQSKRATEFGYWKATGKERNVKSGPNLIGTKRTLVFHLGRAPKGERTEWIMHEYCMDGKSQDSLVVCRLKKNSEFRLNETPNWGSPTRRHSSTLNNSNHAVSEVGIDQTGVAAGHKAAECSSKKCTSSYDSHSIEQIDSASESSMKLTNEVLQPGSSHQKDSDEEENFYADILNDDIIKLDESWLPITPDLLPMVASKFEAERKSKQPVEATTSSVLPFQGTASRRIRLKRRKLGHFHAKALEASDTKYSEEEAKIPKSEHCLKRLMSIFSARMVKRCLVLVILTLMFLFVSLLGISCKFKTITYATLYKDSGTES
ncbi:hypothetical protein L1049_012897 [Liquidambar formosana]|uniref:NAC domain-containing protein n=1 Tax=Liquidambar formosana TaxID=63359 RepID=A0AAP0WTL7_LIQFO